ncbi:hypothetical protein L9F63_000571, partial [Diploptera punctata]
VQNMFPITTQVIMNNQIEIKQEYLLPQTEFEPQDMKIEIKSEIDDPVDSVGNKYEFEAVDPLASLQIKYEVEQSVEEHVMRNNSIVPF